MNLVGCTFCRFKNTDLFLTLMYNKNHVFKAASKRIYTLCVSLCVYMYVNVYIYTYTHTNTDNLYIKIPYI